MILQHVVLDTVAWCLHSMYVHDGLDSRYTSFGLTEWLMFDVWVHDTCKKKCIYLITPPRK